MPTFCSATGGGGKGIRMSNSKEELEQNFVQVQPLGTQGKLRTHGVGFGFLGLLSRL